MKLQNPVIQILCLAFCVQSSYNAIRIDDSKCQGE